MIRKACHRRFLHGFIECALAISLRFNYTGLHELDGLQSVLRYRDEL
jgi:hypothetical protein